MPDNTSKTESITADYHEDGSFGEVSFFKNPEGGGPGVLSAKFQNVTAIWVA